jgi:hypothetical protein
MSEYNVTGWNEKWSFDYEVELWQIPKAEQKVALLYEMRREAGMYYRDFDKTYLLQPWLCLDLKKRNHLIQAHAASSVLLCTHQIALNTMQDIEPEPWAAAGKETDDYLEAHPPAVYKNPKGLLGFGRKGFLDMELGETTTVCLELSSEATRAELIEGFKKALDEIQHTSKSAQGQKDIEDFSGLKALSILRLRHWMDGETFFEPLRKTDFKFWGQKRSVVAIRNEADKYRERILKKMRKRLKADTFRSEGTLLSRTGARPL